MTEDEPQGGAEEPEDPIAAVDIGPYVPDPDLEGVRVSLRAVPLEAESEIQLLSLQERPSDPGAALEHDRRMFEVTRDFIAQAVAEVVGVEDEDGPITIVAGADGRLDAIALAELEGTGSFFFLLAGLARGYQGLSPSEKKRFGARRP